VQLLHEEFEVIEHVKHSGPKPDAFGYASEHLLLMLKSPRAELREWKNFQSVLAEVQVRSILQHAWASISHSLDYKSADQVPPEARRKLFRVAAMLETADEVFDDYREQVNEIRFRYDSDVAEDKWRSLTIDLDSLSAAWQELPIGDLLMAAHAAGFAKSRYSDQEQIDFADDFKWEVNALIAISKAAGLRTLGDVESLMQAAIGDPKLLGRLAEESVSDYSRQKYEALFPNVPKVTQAELRIAAVAPDVAAFVLLARHPMNESLISVAKNEFYPYLVDVAIAVGLNDGDKGKP
jgi:hypothetical protein